MIKTSLVRYGAAALVSGFASLAMAFPAAANTAPDVPLNGTGDGTSYVQPVQSPTPTSENGWAEFLAGAGGGIALVGLVAAAVAGTRHRSHHSAHPA